jgi:protein-disulfide isomerase
MPKIPRKITAVFLILFSAAIVFGAKLIISNLKRNASPDSFLKVKGGEGAPIKITEFLDFQCPACAQGAQYLKEIMEKHPKAVRLELKYFPLAMHAHGELSARYAECAARQGNFWPFHDLLMERQGNWKRLTDARPAFDAIAETVNLNLPKFHACIPEESIGEVIEKNKAEGRVLSVRSTPTYFVNGVMVVGKQSLDSEINKLLKENGY